jgi:hypothetical protein
MFQIPGRRGWFAATRAVLGWVDASTRRHLEFRSPQLTIAAEPPEQKAENFCRLNAKAKLHRGASRRSSPEPRVKFTPREREQVRGTAKRPSQKVVVIVIDSYVPSKRAYMPVDRDGINAH